MRVGSKRVRMTDNVHGKTCGTRRDGRAASSRRAALFRMACPLVALCGCAGGGPFRRAAPRGKRELLAPWLSITGGSRMLEAGKPDAQRVKLQRPVAVAARGDVLVVGDAGARTLWRYEREREREIIEPLAPFTRGADSAVSVQLDAAKHIWLALPAERAVEHLDPQGRLLRQWRNDAEVPRPVALLCREAEGDVVVADGETFQIVSLDRRGKARPLPMVDPPPLKSIAGLAQGPQGLYVLDRLAQQVVVLGPEGKVSEVIGYGQLVLPLALAVDHAGRVFVADEVDQRILVFRGRKLIGRSGTFGRIESLALDGDRLYVADSLLGRVQVLLVTPAA